MPNPFQKIGSEAADDSSSKVGFYSFILKITFVNGEKILIVKLLYNTKILSLHQLCSEENFLLR